MLASELGTIAWRKSSCSGGGSSGGDCVEVTDFQGAAAVRESKRPEGPALLVSGVGWDCFLESVKS
ncbi:DUF397 domain-containing protein [Streptomyces sp. ISL-86]|uniref:DUF397 domain-containing protein n=1 Tax=Streptomyces sp. ISL-86 TaxID=2819187 RepID=UPI001BE6F414|nr:DUF397 domain-containing protein [Streptomyces sp. ISL-86]MBT2456596.1 DUF397 domain-containing protein [Streptomyces sp. ISL-86]